MSTHTVPDANLAALPAAPARAGKGKRPVSLARQLSLAGVLAGFVVIFSITRTGFFSQQTWNSTTQYAAEFLILGAAETFVIISGGIDLSVGSTLGLAGVCAAWTMGHTSSMGTTT